MKIFVFVFSIILFSIRMEAQILDGPGLPTPGQTVHYKKDISISASPNILINSPNGNMFAGGLKIRVFVGERFSFDSDIMFGRNFMQLAPGIIGIPAVLLGYEFGFGTGGEDKTFSEMLIMAALVVLSVEHFAYHIPVKGYTDVSPYISLLRFRQFTDVINSEEPDGVESSVCFAVGLEINKYFKKFVLSPYIDYSRGYSGAIPGVTCGINFGYYFTDK